MSFTLNGPVERGKLEKLGQITSHDASRVVIRVPHAHVRDVVSRSLNSLPIVDLSIEDPPLEEIMRQLFSTESTSAGTTAGQS